jgi:hypothetical protein
LKKSDFETATWIFYIWNCAASVEVPCWFGRSPPLGASNAHPKGAFQMVENGRQRVRAITMDTLMCETGILSIDLLKVESKAPK